MNSVAEFEWRASNANVFYPFTQRPLAGDLDLTGYFADAQLACGSARVRLTGLTEDPSGGWTARLAGEEPDWSADIPLERRDQDPWVLWSGPGLWLLGVLDREWTDLSGLDIRDAWLVPHVLNAEPRRLDGLRVGEKRLTGDIRLEAGYNLRVEPGERRAGVRAGWTLRLGVEPGAGAGLEPCRAGTCRTALRAVNAVRPDAVGNLRLAGLDCYNVTPRLQEASNQKDRLLADGELLLGNSCGPCCDCSDYGYMYGEVLGELLERAKLLAARQRDLRRRYQELAARHAELVECMSRPVLELRVTGMFRRTAAVALGLRNNSSAPWPRDPAEVTLDIGPAGGRLVDGTVGWYDGGDLLPIRHSLRDGRFTAEVPPVPCCSVGWVVFNLVWDGAGGFVTVEVSGRGGLDGVAYALAGRAATKPPVNRER